MNFHGGQSVGRREHQYSCSVTQLGIVDSDDSVYSGAILGLECHYLGTHDDIGYGWTKPRIDDKRLMVSWCQRIRSDDAVEAFTC